MVTDYAQTEQTTNNGDYAEPDVLDFLPESLSQVVQEASSASGPIPSPERKRKREMSSQEDIKKPRPAMDEVAKERWQQEQDECAQCGRIADNGVCRSLQCQWGG